MVETPVRLSDTHKLPPGNCEMPHGFFSCGSTTGALPSLSAIMGTTLNDGGAGGGPPARAGQAKSMRPAARPIFIFISCPRDGGFRGLELLRARNVIKRNSGNPS